MELPLFRNRKGHLLDATLHPAAREDCLVVLGHGVTGNKDRPLIVGLAEALAALGLPALRFSYAGNGGSEGRFEDATITAEGEDLEDLLDQLPPDRRIAFVGHSMSGAVGVLTAAARPERITWLVSLAGMVETAAFCDREFGEVEPDKGLMWDEPDCPLSAAFVADLHGIASIVGPAAKVTQPWLIVHGDADDVVPIRDSRLAAGAATGLHRFLPMQGEGHMFSPSSYSIIAEAIAAWMVSNPAS